MIRIAGVSINPKKHARFALTAIRGIGPSNVKIILRALNIPFDARLGDLEETKIVELRNHIEENYLVEADLKRQEQANIKRLIDIGCWRGKRHQLGLPVRGQRTRTNNRTRRGNKRISAGSGRAKAPSKT